ALEAVGGGDDDSGRCGCHRVMLPACGYSAGKLWSTRNAGYHYDARLGCSFDGVIVGAGFRSLRSLRVLAWLLAAASLVACGSDEPELPPAVTQPVTIRIAAFEGPETTALFRIIPEWEHITGNTVELGILDRETGERMVAQDYVTYRDSVISN